MDIPLARKLHGAAAAAVENTPLTEFNRCCAQVVPPYWAQEAPVDTCGAGDAYAAGVLWAYLRGMGVAAMGRAGARVASQVRLD